MRGKRKSERRATKTRPHWLVILREALRAHPVISYAAGSACWVLLLYARILGSPFVYDDQDQVQTNPALLSWHTFAHSYIAAAHPFSGIFRGAGGGASYRPLFWLTLAVDRHVYGLDVTGYHLSNLLLHWANGLLVFVLLRRLGARPMLAWITPLIWLSLPINSEAVIWISARSYGLAAFFILLSLLAADWYLRKRSYPALVCYCGAFICALLSHEIGILALPGVFLLAYFKKGSYTPRWLYMAGGVVTLSYIAIRVSIAGSSFHQQAWGWWGVGSTIVKYFGWIVLPIHLSIERSTETPVNDFSFANAAAWGAVILLAVAVFVWRHKKPMAAGGMAWALLALAPFSGIVFVYQGMAERYAYLASMGVVLSLGSLALKFSSPRRPVVAVLLTIWALWGVWRLEARLGDWRDEVSLYASSLKTDPDSPVLLLNLGSTLSDAGHLGDGLFLIKKALSLKPDYELAYRALGNTLLEMGAIEQAKETYRKALALDANDVRAMTDLGDVYIKLRDFRAAEIEFRRALQLSPGNIVIDCDLGIDLFYEGKSDEALKQLLEAVQLDPENASPYYFLGFIEEQMGARQAALQMYEKALELRPDYMQARRGRERLENQQ